MAKKKASGEFNMAEAIRAILSQNTKLSAGEVMETIAAQHPSAKLNKNSFTVAFYSARKKLGIGSSGRGRKAGAKKVRATAAAGMNMSSLQSAAKFLSEVGSASAAIEAIKQVQALQLK